MQLDRCEHLRNLQEGAMKGSKIRRVGMVVVASLSLMVSAWAASENALYNFKPANGYADGYTLAIDDAGNLYGATEFSGVYSQGEIYQVKRTGDTWHLHTIYSFEYTNGAFPESGPIWLNGHLYGTTVSAYYGGAGVVYELTQTRHGWEENVLYTFPYQAIPSGELVADAQGNLYGTTLHGTEYGTGSVFELENTKQGWHEKDLYFFSTTEGPWYPAGGLVLDRHGNIYGVTQLDSDGGTGSVFELEHHPDGSWVEKTLLVFGLPTNGANGLGPNGHLVFDEKGNLYGTTSGGGDLTCGRGSGCGTVYELSPDGKGGWTETVLFEFKGARGEFPVAGLVMDAAGNLYGTTANGGEAALRISPGMRNGVRAIARRRRTMEGEGATQLQRLRWAGSFRRTRD